MSARAPGPPYDPDRLHGWKEIASFVGKGVRTVQRWEKEHGLPVRRLGDGSDIVFASKRQIEEWMLASSSGRGDLARYADTGNVRHDVAADPCPDIDDPLRGVPAAEVPDTARTPVPRLEHARRPYRVSVLGGIAVLLVLPVVAGLSKLVSEPAPSPNGLPPVVTARQPERWEASGRSLRILDRSGALVWEHRFEWEIDEASLMAAVPGRRHDVVIEDLDGDGRRDVLVVARVRHGYYDEVLMCFDAAGTKRFEYRPTHVRQFGSKTYAAPWNLFGVYVTATPATRPRVWVVSNHVPWFPSVVEELDPVTGRVLATYWSGGYIHSVREIRWRGKQYLAVGATNNERKAASLALFPTDRVAGSSPAGSSSYRCTDCPPGRPEVFVVFPSSCIRELENGQSVVSDVGATPDGDVRVYVWHATGDESAGQPREAYVIYTLGPDLRLASIEPTPQFELLHSLMRKAGRLDHDLGPADAKWLLPVVRWEDGQFVDLNHVDIDH
jgi:hypothetical protein